jgi:cell division septation protein DedD
MAPLLIDSRDMLKLVFASAVITVVVFASGFFIGLHRADAFYQAGAVVQSLVLPEPVQVADISDSKLPARIDAGENIDVDQPDHVVQTTEENPDAMSENKEAPTSLEDDNSITSRPVISQQDIIVKQAEVSPEVLLETSSKTAELSKIKYTIQAGVYGSLHNAENMMKMLQAKKYEAYISDYVNGESETRYNVRFGYFSDRKSANLSLEKYKSNKNSDGYLVRFSAENIVNIARAAADAPDATTPALSDESENGFTPAASQPENDADKVSQADVLKNINIISN